MKRVCNQINVEIVKRSDAGKFVALPKRWDRRTHDRLAVPIPPIGQGLGVHKP
jgi:hypothetical protein